MREADCSTYKFRTLTGELARPAGLRSPAADIETETYTLQGWCGPIQGERIKAKP